MNSPGFDLFCSIFNTLSNIYLRVAVMDIYIGKFGEIVIK